MLGLRIRERRRELGLEVSDLAGRMGVTESAIYMIERGERGKGLSLETAVRLAGALEVAISDIRAWQEEEKSSRPPAAAPARGRSA